jgi:hypothetical protein
VPGGGDRDLSDGLWGAARGETLKRDGRADDAIGPPARIGGGVGGRRRRVRRNLRNPRGRALPSGERRRRGGVGEVTGGPRASDGGGRGRTGGGEREEKVGEALVRAI